MIHRKGNNQPVMRRWVPSMFSRRLLLLAVGAVGVGLVLAVQLARLTVVQGAMWRQKAEAVLVQRRLIPTARGRVLDRRMRVLAEDRASYDVCVRYPVVTGQWAYKRGRAAAYREHREQWRQIDEVAREALITRYQRPYE